MFTLVPANFFKPEAARDALADVAVLNRDDEVKYKEIPAYSAVLIYSVSGGADALPEIFYILQELPSCNEYNKLLCSWKDGEIFLAIAQGKSLLIANSYKAADFTTAQYYIFLAMKSLQLNPEVTTIRFRHPLSAENEMALYRYFKAVECL
ncbi:MAG: DUF3822 family protein [Bacteroidales bacterium]|nr:DUF3822 family protein [Bacteroidales bacterium]